MPAKLTVIVYILICFEVGILLLILPWTSYWDENFFLYFLSGKLRAEWLAEWLTSGYVRGAVTGLGAVNIGAGIWELSRFRHSVRAFTAWEAQPDDGPPHSAAEASAPASAALPDNRQADTPANPGESEKAV
ncbi:MAG: hypothetical protein KF868_10850 [Acidobacteria bacterium]|nr:hypothetical protein [Acidobacteriota bacterium]MCW5969062.1 hypothetical protein [Blastocatellales bacterium]